MKSDEILIKTFDQVKNDNFDQVKFDQVIVCPLTMTCANSAILKKSATCDFCIQNCRVQKVQVTTMGHFSRNPRFARFD